MSKRVPPAPSANLPPGAVPGPASDASLPSWLPAALYGLLSLVLFRKFVVSSDMLFGTDAVALGYFAREFYADLVRSVHEFPFWNPYLFGGLPFVDAMHGDIFYPTTLLSFVMPVHRAMGWKLVLHVFLAGLFTYLWLRQIRASRLAALWGGLAYMLAPVLVSLVYPGHDGKLFVTALTPLLFWATDRAITGTKLGAYAVLALVVALLTFTAHMQLAYFALWGALGWALYRIFGWRGPAALLPALLLFAVGRAWVGGLAAIALLVVVAGAALVALAVWRPDQRGPLARLTLFGAAGVLGAAVAAVQLVGPACYLGGGPRALCGETFGYSQRVEKTTEAEAERGYAYSTSWSLHAEEAVSLLVPEFIGANLSTSKGRVDTYWGRNPFKLNHEYAGVVGLMLAPVLFLRRRGDGRNRPGHRGGEGRADPGTRAVDGESGGASQPRAGDAGFFVSLAALALVYALGATTPLFRVFYELLPGVKLFRAPSSIMFLFSLAAATLGALAIDALRAGVRDPDFGRRLRKYLLALVAVLGAFAFLGSIGRLLPEIWTATFYPEIAPQKAQALDANLTNIERGLWITFAIGASLAGLLWGLLRGRLAVAGLVAGLLLLAGFDEWRASTPFIQTAAPAALFPTDEAVRYLQEENRRRAEPFRVFSLVPDDNLPALYGLEQVRGHHGNEIGRYRALLEGDRLVRHGFRLLKLLNAAFVLSPQEVRAPGLTRVGAGRRWFLYRLEGAFPRAFLVGGTEVLPDSLALRRLLEPDFDPLRTALLPEPLPLGLEPEPQAGGSVRWISRSVNREVLEVNATGPALLVLSENFYPAWRARVDGEPAGVVRADIAFRAVPVPQGRHEIELFYRSDLFWASLAISLGTGAVVLAGVFASWVRERRRRERAGPDV